MTILHRTARILAYGALPAFLYLIAVVAIGAGAERGILFPIFYVWIIAGFLIHGWVEKRRTRRE